MTTLPIHPDAEVTLRPLRQGDVPSLTLLLRANRSFLAESGPLRTDDYFTPEAQERAVLTSLEAAKNGTAYPMVILDGQGSLIGTLNLSSIIRGAFQSTSIGYWVAQSHNGKGVATAAVAGAKHVAFTELRLHRIQAATRAENIASQRVLLKNGFVKYGVAPDYLKIAGRWREHTLFQAVAADDATGTA